MCTEDKKFLKRLVLVLPVLLFALMQALTIFEEGNTALAFSFYYVAGFLSSVVLERSFTFTKESLIKKSLFVALISPAYSLFWLTYVGYLFFESKSVDSQKVFNVD